MTGKNENEKREKSGTAREKSSRVYPIWGLRTEKKKQGVVTRRGSYLRPQNEGWLE